ncbi:hypothetical protein MHTCC0001_12080 [Flavobacteriaceae bacterium MHTCC 0001]
MKTIHKHIALLTIVTSIIYGCIEPVTVTTDEFEDILVVEATITNELKFQEIKLSRTFELNTNDISFTNNTDVSLTEEGGNVFVFKEEAPGIYISDAPFAAKPNTSYQLTIKTANNTYTSTAKMVDGNAKIETINFVHELDDNGDEGISVNINSFDPTGNSRYYRYEFEETYKIIAPFWSRLKINVVSPTAVEFTENTDQNRICYGSRFSSGILQTETTGLTEDRILQKRIQFLKIDDYAIAERYSILIKQFTQSPEAFAFYKTLNELSNSESLLSDNQPGFVKGNINSVGNPDEEVIGFFEISNVSNKREFFSWRDIFPSSQRRPPYKIQNCTLLAPQFDANDNELIDVLNAGYYIYFRENWIIGDTLIPNGGPYVLVQPECGDCTRLGSNVPPDFWIE